MSIAAILSPFSVENGVSSVCCYMRHFTSTVVKLLWKFLTLILHYCRKSSQLRSFPQLPFWISRDNEVSHIARRCQGWERKMRENSGVELDGPRYGLKGRERWWGSYGGGQQPLYQPARWSGGAL